jgi:DNA-binding response OmpR family regulator/anti-anti-sigma regulatory factor
MLRVLTVDDSRAVRSIVRKQIIEMGFEPVEAEDGTQGLVKLQESTIDLVLLDVTMPVMDGPTMLAKMRESGNKTPVIMLTSESKRSIVAGAMKLGIDDYILKPFKPEELKAKMLSVIGAADADEDEDMVMANGAGQGPSGASGHAATGEGARQFVDVMVVDDMENVGRKLRTMLPPHMTMASFTSAQAALAACREKTCRVIMVDSDLPDVASNVFTRQLRLLQQHAALLAMPLRSTNDLTKEMKDNGFDDILFKPFNQDSIDDFLLKYFDNQEILICEDNLFKVGGFHGKEDRLATYFTRLEGLFGEALKKAASACYDEVIVDLSQAPARQEKLPRMLLEFAEASKQNGIEIKLVGNAEVKKILSAFTETRAIPLFQTVQEARSGAAA